MWGLENLVISTLQGWWPEAWVHSVIYPVVKNWQHSYCFIKLINVIEYNVYGLSHCEYANRYIVELRTVCALNIAFLMMQVIKEWLSTCYVCLLFVIFNDHLFAKICLLILCSQCFTEWWIGWMAKQLTGCLNKRLSNINYCSLTDWVTD